MRTLLSRGLPVAEAEVASTPVIMCAASSPVPVTFAQGVRARHARRLAPRVGHGHALSAHRALWRRRGRCVQPHGQHPPHTRPRIAASDGAPPPEGPLLAFRLGYQLVAVMRSLCALAVCSPSLTFLHQTPSSRRASARCSISTSPPAAPPPPAPAPPAAPRRPAARPARAAAPSATTT